MAHLVMQPTTGAAQLKSQDLWLLYCSTRFEKELSSLMLTQVLRADGWSFDGNLICKVQSYGFVPMCESKEEMERISILEAGKAGQCFKMTFKYHISALSLWILGGIQEKAC